MDAMKDSDIILLMIASLAALTMALHILGKTRVFSLGRINVKKKYRFHQIVGETSGGGPILSPVVLAETNRFRNVEKLRDSISCPRVAIVYEPEVLNAQN